jgi:hypothetical protein
LDPIDNGQWTILEILGILRWRLDTRDPNVGRCNTLAGFGNLGVLPPLGFVLRRLRRVECLMAD